MKQRMLSRVLLSIGTLTLICGAMVHGVFRDSRDAEDRRQMTRGTEIAVGGLLVLSLGIFVHQAARESSFYQD